jgi:plastocyanin
VHHCASKRHWRHQARLAIALGACLAAMAAARPAAPEAQGTGTIAGTVALTTRMRGIPIGTDAYASRTITRQQAPASPEMRSVVVYVKGIAAQASPKAMHAEIRQEHESFSPRVLAVTRGSTVDFPNFDPYFHNVFSLSGAATFDLGRFPAGQSRARQFTKPGVVKVYCHIHSQMSATILVLDHPFFTTPASDGTFTLTGVPAGSYTLTGWHERVGEHSAPITVHANETTNVHLALPVEDTP